MVVEAPAIEVDTLDQHVRRDHEAALQHRGIVTDADYDAVANTGNFRDQSDHLMLW